MVLDQRITALEDAIVVLKQLYGKATNRVAEDKLWNARKCLEAQLSGMVANA
jgi:hypothetical protein